ncbi:MAG: hypothetical protein JWM68_3747 [Verrucomicrobiales bacterium]|nr:hypothetical protein [Verrucomicrobiales bacterium]
MKQIKNILIAGFLWALVYFSTLQPVWWCQNLFTFMTAIAVTAILIGLTEARKKELIKSHHDGKHCPEWFDHLTYVLIIFPCAAYGLWWKAGIWLLMMGRDLSARAEAQKEKNESAKKETPSTP